MPVGTCTNSYYNYYAHVDMIKISELHNVHGFCVKLAPLLWGGYWIESVGTVCMG